MHIEVKDEKVILNDINELCELKLVFNLDGFYAIQNKLENVTRRLDGNKLAKKFVPKALKNANLIGSFPYVRGVGISGSLSKGYMDESGDVDYFIITEPERLWIARTFLIIYKKIFLLNNRKFFCVNYFIDTNHLEIPDKNIFTATEILTLIPAYNPITLNNFLTQNQWTKTFLPNKSPTNTTHNSDKNPFLKNTFEYLLNNKFGNFIDTFFMKLTLQKWKRKFKHIQETDFELALRSRKYVSKHHPQGFQQRVLSAIDNKSTLFETENNIKLS
jgi:hypothetical protein